MTPWSAVSSPKRRALAPGRLAKGHCEDPCSQPTILQNPKTKRFDSDRHYRQQSSGAPTYETSCGTDRCEEDFADRRKWTQNRANRILLQPLYADGLRVSELSLPPPVRALKAGFTNAGFGRSLKCPNIMETNTVTKKVSKRPDAHR
jgi:hypothetical protein